MPGKALTASGNHGPRSERRWDSIGNQCRAPLPGFARAAIERILDFGQQVAPVGGKLEIALAAAWADAMPGCSVAEQMPIQGHDRRTVVNPIVQSLALRLVVPRPHAGEAIASLGMATDIGS